MQQISMNTGEKLGIGYMHLIGRHDKSSTVGRMVWCEVVCWDVVWGLRYLSFKVL